MSEPSPLSHLEYEYHQADLRNKFSKVLAAGGFLVYCVLMYRAGERGNLNTSEGSAYAAGALSVGIGSYINAVYMNYDAKNKEQALYNQRAAQADLNQSSA